MSTLTRPNLLVISDLHLGEDLKPSTTPMSYLRRIVKLERELESFLSHYATTRLSGLPWRLVVNGDMVDFMSVMILPTAAAGGDADEKQFGLAFGARQTVEKLNCVFERHAGVFQRLADFVAAGNELVVVMGNHDAEFHFPEVQRRFVELLAERMPGDVTAASRIRFCPWFYYEEERVYVEHGHQYDEYCSFDYQLQPVDTKGSVALSIAHAGIRYFTNLVPSIDPSVGETWGFVDYIKWAWGHGAHAAGRLFYFYGMFAWKSIALWHWLTNAVDDGKRRVVHEARLHALSVDYRIAEDKMRALDRLRVAPVIKQLGKTLKTLFLDRMLVAVSAVLMLVIVLVLAPGWFRLGGAGVVLLACVATNWLLSRSRVVSPDDAMRRAPAAIRAILRAPFIVFGHTHRAESVPLPGGGTYFNTGSWAQDDLSSAFTHLLITGEDQPHAELCQWREGHSAPFTPVPRNTPKAVPAVHPAVAIANR